ncbi:Trp biosynthesis-associated membrane protein [Microbacterium sp. SA39]|uniref:Trp biosynthesis-associated membrane protein n=1 Tax=Microbacterium sp. SA39 TaxID=1263625 RepID=UPI00061EC203|nr:Trp biosynthesis-associated membrane protein [Microbacterium sp. SA39]KJQ54785.1 Tryptophan-associated transmembrane protein [Microbacterium sp. SA39]
MSLAQRGRSLSVSGFLLAGAIGIISSTQTWLTVERADAGAAILVPGASALVLLAPLSLAVLALGAALSIAAPIVRVVFAVLAGAASVLLGWSTVQMLASPIGSVGPAVAEATGLAGEAALQDMVQEVVPTAWPIIALIGWVILLAASVFVLLTWRGWKAGGRRYRTDAEAAQHEGPVDAVDSWDELSRGTDPTR